MTQKQLLENLNKTSEKTLFGKNFKIVGKINYKNTSILKAKSLHILVLKENGEPETYLIYRLDINYLVKAFDLDGSLMSARKLKQYEDAIKQNED